MRHPPAHRQRPSRTLALTALCATTALAVTVPASTVSAASAEGTVRHLGGATAVADSYIVVLKDDTAANMARSSASPDIRTRVGRLAVRHHAHPRYTYGSALHGFSATMSAADARRLAAEPDVAYVEQDHVVRLADTQPNPPSWGLDRVDQRNLPLDHSYTYNTSAANVHAYIIDSGVRMTHTTFGGRATSGWDFVDNDSDASDFCVGHGTHVAGTIGGAQYGVVKAAQIVAVRVLGCNGMGSFATIAAGVDWVTAHAVKPAVANMSLGGPISDAVDAAVRNSIASGITYAIAAGNENQDACNVSPARVTEAITVGATDSGDGQAGFSNWGRCLDLYAPGVGVTSAWISNDTDTKVLDGTSMAAPHAAGAAALYLAGHPSASPAQVRDALVANATPNVIHNVGGGSPNALLYTGPATTPPPPPPHPPGYFENLTHVGIPDAGPVVGSVIAVTGMPAYGPTNLQVGVNIQHSCRGDLNVDLVAPNGARWRLKNWNLYDCGANVVATYVVNASSVPANGTWTLIVQDVQYARGWGYIDNWHLQF